MKTLFPLILLLFIGCSSGTVKSDKAVETFFFHYTCDSGDELNTFEGYLVKDLDFAGKRKVECHISLDETARVLAKLEEIHFFEMKSPYPSRPWSGDKPTWWPNKLLVVFGNQEVKYIEWDNYLSERSPAKELHELREFLSSVIQNTTEWKSLPPRQGGAL